MATLQPAPQDSFGDLLRRFRLEAGLSQEALAERARMSARGISDLERGTHRAPYRDTVRLLAEALGLGEAERALFEATARPSRLARRAGSSGPDAAPEGDDSKRVTGTAPVLTPTQVAQAGPPRDGGYAGGLLVGARLKPTVMHQVRSVHLSRGGVGMGGICEWE